MIIVIKYSQRSLQIIEPENVLDLLVVGVLLPDPIGMFHPQLVPQPVSQVRMELSIGMESVATLNHILGISALLHPSL